MTTVKLQNLDCANCAGKIEKRLNELDELSNVKLNFATWGHNRKRKLLYGRSHLSSKSSKILNVKNPRFLHSI